MRSRIAGACAAAGRPVDDVTLVAVSKNHPVTTIVEARRLGQLEFGENRVQELAAKATALQSDPPRWHMIGSVQTNKVRDLLATPGLALVHSLDRDKLADALQARLSADAGEPRTLACLLEINASGDQGKHGVLPEAAAVLLAHVQAACPSLMVRGLMAMGPLAGDPRPTFDRVVRLRDDLRDRSGLALPVLSLGMSGDFEIAIAAGSTMIRVGTDLFGPRAT
ncbi:MAG: YggS family pyridoxal phosphate-dependent enzyme [Planctomycetota bacterium]